MPKEIESIKKKLNTSKQGKAPNLGLAAGLYYLPVGAGQLVHMPLHHELPSERGDVRVDVSLLDASKPPEHAQGFPSRHLVEDGVRLRAVADLALHLFRTEMYNR